MVLYGEVKVTKNTFLSRIKAHGLCITGGTRVKLFITLGGAIWK